VFKVGDKVVDPFSLEVGEGTIRARYRHHYLVIWDKAPKWRLVTHKKEKDIVAASSPITPKLLELERRCNELGKEQDEIDKQIKELIKGGK